MCYLLAPLHFVPFAWPPYLSPTYPPTPAPPPPRGFNPISPDLYSTLCIKLLPAQKTLGTSYHLLEGVNTPWLDIPDSNQFPPNLQPSLILPSHILSVVQVWPLSVSYLTPHLFAFMPLLFLFPLLNCPLPHLHIPKFYPFF